jgi:nitroreductase/NAD-dependent dihydropyrimidine dehydrogenase PreA subunit
MNLVSIDPEKCQRDGICVAECPLRLLEMNPLDAVPAAISEADELCIRCGHCVVVCPTGALSHKNLSSEVCPPVRKGLALGPEQVEHFMRSRRSIRTYKKTPVDMDTIIRVIDIARFAPSGHNSQPVRWLVIQESKDVLRMAGMVIDWMRYVQKEHPAMAQTLRMDRAITAWEAGMDPICRSAPHVVVAYGDKANMMAQTACVIALTYLELAAPTYRLGACWAGYFNAAAMSWPPLQHALSLPKNHASYGAMMIGYPKFAYHRLPERKEADISWR